MLILNFAFKPRLVVILMLIILFSMLFPHGKSIVAILLLPLSIIDRNKAIFALIAVFLVRMSNPAVAGPDPLLASAAWMTSLIASTRLWCDFVLHKNCRIPNPIKALFFFVLIVLVLSSFSISPIISILKVIGFYYIAGAVFVGVKISESYSNTVLSWLYAMWISVLLTSILVLAFPEVGYFRDGQGFQGSFNHPQALGVFIAPIIALLLAKIISAKRMRTDFFALIILLIILYITRARTGVASILLGGFILCLFRFGLVRFNLKWFSQRKYLVIISVILLMITPVLYKNFQSEINGYVFKSATSDNLSVAFDESRGFIILQAINNIESNPLTGIGFGVANSLTQQYNIELDGISGLPVGAPTEKANLIIAVLEETGIIGFLPFLVFFLLFLRAIANSESIALAWAALTIVCTNISEMTFFSMGGIGLYTWIICAVAVAIAPSHYKNSKASRC